MPAPVAPARGDRPGIEGRISRVGRALVPVVLVLASVASGRAQTVEVVPFGGYRFGGSFSEIPSGTVVDDDGGASVGVIVNIDLGQAWEGVKLEGVYSRQRANLGVRAGSLAPLTEVIAVVDQVLVGGTRELSAGRSRPFLSGLLGITRYSVPGDIDVRFAVGVGTGLKAYLTPHVGLRLDARAYITIIDLDGAGVCGGSGCAIRFHVNPAVQGDATVGLLIAF